MTGEKVEVKFQVPYHKTIAGLMGGTIEVHRHTPECREKYLASLGRQQDWISRWPNHCGTCRGWGVTEYTENQSPLGSGHIWLMNMTEPCTFCTESDVCARCGHQHDEGWSEDELVPCEKCGWNWGAADDFMPDTYECACWEEDYEQHMKELDEQERAARKKGVADDSHNG